MVYVFAGALVIAGCLVIMKAPDIQQWRIDQERQREGAWRDLRVELNKSKPALWGIRIFGAWFIVLGLFVILAK